MPNPQRLKVTWKDLKTICEQAGVKDDDPLDVVEIAWGDAGQLTCHYDEDFGWQITQSSACSTSKD